MKPSVIWTLRIALLFLVAFLAIWELFLKNTPDEANAIINEIHSAGKIVKESATPHEIVFDRYNNLITLYRITEQEKEKVREYQLSTQTEIVETSFLDNLLTFDEEGIPSEGGSVTLLDKRGLKRKGYKVLISAEGSARIDRSATRARKRAEAWIGAICVVAIFSYLYRENNFYRFFEHILLGVALGYGTAIVVRQTLWEKWWLPMKSGFQNLFTEGYTPDDMLNAALIIPGILGLMWYFQYSKKYLWLSRVVIGITAGAAAGLGIKGTIVSNWPQITGTFKNIVIRAEQAPHLGFNERLILSFENMLILLIVVCVVYYFFFSFRRDTKATETPANMGRMFLMISLGAFFGNTFLTRVVILIDRVQFLFRDWLMLGG